MNYFLPISVLAIGLYIYYVHTPELIDGESSFTMYHSHSCPHCKRAYPEFRKLGNYYKNIRIRWVESMVNNELDVDGYPTFIYRNTNGELHKYTGARNANSFKKYLDSFE